MSRPEVATRHDYHVQTIARIAANNRALIAHLRTNPADLAGAIADMGCLKTAALMDRIADDALRSTDTPDARAMAALAKGFADLARVRETTEKTDRARPKRPTKTADAPAGDALADLHAAE